MGAAFDGGDVVGIGVDIFGIGVVVLDGDLDKAVAVARRDIDRLLVQDFLVLVQVFDKGNDAAVVMQDFLCRPVRCAASVRLIVISLFRKAISR